MRFIGYNPQGMQVYEIDKYTRAECIKSGETVREGNQRIPALCWFKKENQMYDSLIRYVTVKNEKLSAEYLAQFHKDIGGIHHHYNPDRFSNRFFELIRNKKILLDSDIRKANRIYNLLRKNLRVVYDFNTQINIMKLTEGMDHVRCDDPIGISGALPPAVMRDTDCPNNFLMIDNEPSYSLLRYDRHTQPDGAHILVYSKGYHVDNDSSIYKRGYFKVKHHAVIDDDDILLLYKGEVEEPTKRYFEDMDSFFRFYKTISPFKPKEIKIDQDEFFESKVEKVPYKSLSKLRHPFTSAPAALVESTQTALNKFQGKYGDIDKVVGDLIGFDEDKMIDVFTAEQIDAIGLWKQAHDSNCSFLLADQTGIGKGRALAAIAKIWLKGKKKRKVIYFTENTEINIPDVWRDFTAVEATDIKPLIVGGKRIQVGGVWSLSPKEKAELYKGELDTGKNRLIITNYSQFRKITENIDWLLSQCDKHTLLILDESHNALAPKSNTGKSIREALDKLKRNNTVFATATPLRDIRGIDLYERLLAPDDDFKAVTKVLASRGISSQEALVTTLAEDGTYLRRDHDMSGLSIDIDLPSNELEEKYLDQMSAFSDILKKVMRLKHAVKYRFRHMGDDFYDNMLADGLRPGQGGNATAQEMLRSNAINTGVAVLSRLFLNAIKVDQAAAAVIREIKDGRKPMVTFHSTNQAMIKKIDGELNFSAAIMATADKMRAYGLSEGQEDENERVEATYNDVIEAAQNLKDLTISPIDTLQEMLAEEGISSEEISGRTAKVVDGTVEVKPACNKKEIVDRFNSGETDVLIYNQAGATGGSFHSSPEFKDQRPRTIVEMETPLDIIKYVQSQGRGNRYGQVYSPKLLTVSSGLVPEMRIIQQRNVKLKKLGASTDGSRSSHPILAEEEVDLLNSVGNKATAEVLRTEPELCKELGLDDITNTGEEIPLGKHDNLANKVLSYAIILPIKKQKKLFNNIKTQFKYLIEQLNEANMNPLQLKEIRTPIKVHGTINLQEVAEDKKIAITGIKRDVTLTQGSYYNLENSISTYQIFSEVRKAKEENRDDKVSSILSYITTNQDLYLAPYISHQQTVQEVRRQSNLQSQSFKNRLDTLQKITGFLSNFKCGSMYKDKIGGQKRMNIIVDIDLPDEPQDYLKLHKYVLKIVSAGSSRIKRKLLMNATQEIYSKLNPDYYTSTFTSDTFPSHFARVFDDNRKKMAVRSVHILGGNLMASMEIALQNNLHSRSLCLYKTTENELRRGIVIDSDTFRADIVMVKVSDKLSKQIAKKYLKDSTERGWGYGSLGFNLDNKAHVIIRYVRFVNDEGEVAGALRCRLSCKRMTEKQKEVFIKNHPNLEDYTLKEVDATPEKFAKDFKGLTKYCRRSEVKEIFAGAGS